MAAAILAMSMTVVMISCKKKSSNDPGTCTCTYTNFQTGESYTTTESMSEAQVTSCAAMEFYIQGDSQNVCK